MRAQPPLLPGIVGNRSSEILCPRALVGNRLPKAVPEPCGCGGSCGSPAIRAVWRIVIVPRRTAGPYGTASRYVPVFPRARASYRRHRCVRRTETAARISPERLPAEVSGCRTSLRNTFRRRPTSRRPSSRRGRDTTARSVRSPPRIAARAPSPVRIAQVVPGAVRHEGDEPLGGALRVAQQPVGRADEQPDQVDVPPFVESADVVRGARPAAVEDRVDGAGVVLDVEPVPYVLGPAGCC